MEIIVLEIILWAGLLFFFWTLKDGLGRVEDNMAEPTGKRFVLAGQSAPTLFTRPDSLIEPIGSYMDQVVYRYAISGGQHYQFDSILTGDGKTVTIPAAIHGEAKASAPKRMYLAPGLLYLECAAPN